MIPAPIACDQDLLRLSLDERLSEAQEEALAQHLSQCEPCQRELERIAGQQQDWSRVGSALKFDAEHPSAAAQSVAHGWGDSDAPDKDDDAAADFAVDFLEPSPASDALGRLGDIDIVEVLGRGGMGIVLKGHQTELKRLVAIKVLAPHLAVSGAARKRFAREAQAAAAILHPNVMPILTVNSTGKLPYLVMPYLAGESLEQRIRRTGPLEVTDLLRIGVQAAQGLAAAHAQGLIHRDIKPANILLEQGIERVMLTDFGLARAIDDASITRTGLIAGTPQYMSPEQARGEPLDARSDLFSLGGVLYAMATGRPPFRAESTYGILRRIADDEPRAVCEVNPQIPQWLAAIIGRLLAKQPADRFASAGEVASLLERCLAHVQQPLSVALPAECAPGPIPPTGRALRRRTLQLAGAVALTIGVVVAGVTSWQLTRTRKSETATLSPPGESPATTNTETAWNASSAEVDDLFRDLDAYVHRAKRLWDEDASEQLLSADMALAQGQAAPAALMEEAGWDPYGNTEKLAAMKGWVLSWDRRNYTSHGDGKRRAMLRIFPDGRVLAVRDYGDPLLEGRLTPQELEKVVDFFVEQGKERKPKALKIDPSAGAMLSETYKELQSALRKLEREHALGDPLPEALWDQIADRVTAIRGDKLYDLMSVSPSQSSKPGQQWPISLAEFTGEFRAKLGKLVVLAAIGSTAERDRLAALAGEELRRRHPETPIRLTAEHLSYAGRNRDGSLYIHFDFTRVPNEYSFPSGELTLRVPRGGEPFVAKARYWIDAQTEDRWGTRTEKPSP
jgi:serine/threonine protein kinase